MHSSSVLLLCILVTCSVWAVYGASLEVKTDDQEQVDVEVDISLPGVCWACKWALNKVKKRLNRNNTAENVKAKLLAVCDGIGLLKNACRKFVKTHLGLLIEELTTTDDVRTICVNAGACKPKEVVDLQFYLLEGASASDNDEFA